MPAEAWKFSPADAVAAFPADPSAMRFAYLRGAQAIKQDLEYQKESLRP